MEAVLHRQRTAPPAPLQAPPAIDEAPARRSLRRQIARLETELGGLVVSSWPREGLGAPPDRAARGARVLGVAALEEQRDRLAERLGAMRRALDERGREQEGYRRLREEMLLEPELHTWTRVSNADVGEPGCKDWHVRPRFGLLGMLMRWWRVHISSGCP
jgi:hypothetical protein